MSVYIRKTDTDTRPSGELVDATPAREHVAALAAKGMSGASIARKCGLTPGVIYGLLNGTHRVNGKLYQVKQCSPGNAARILAVEFEAPWDPEGFSPEKFRRVRESRNLSRFSLGKLAQLNDTTIQHWETGRSKPAREDKIRAALDALGASWEDVSGPVEKPGDDGYSVEFVDEYIPDYPCLVCGHTFRSRHLLANHPHPKKRKPNAT